MKLNPTVAALAFAALCNHPALADDATPPAATLYERLGGLRGITPLVDDFVDHLLSNEHLSGNTALKAGQREAPPAFLKFQLAEALCEMSGGPCVYSGPALKETFSPYKVSEKDWEAMTAELKRSLDKFRVPAVDQEEILGLALQTKSDIIAEASPPAPEAEETAASR